MRRREFLAGAGALVAGAATPALAYDECWNDAAYGPLCRAGIRSTDFRRVSSYQHTMVWCWAATLEMIFRWNGIGISQENIVAQTYGGIIPTTIDPYTLMTATRRRYVDDYGGPFDVRSQVFSAEFGIQTLDNRDIVRELRSESPLVICNASHMMVLIGAVYRDTWSDVPEILSAWVADPFPYTQWAPDMGPGFRDLPLADIVPATTGGNMHFLSTVRVG